MSTAVEEKPEGAGAGAPAPAKPAKPPKPKISVFGRKERRLVSDPLWDDNPITLQVLGICSALAVTTQMYPTLVMAAALTAVVTGSNVIVSLLRHWIPSRIRMIVELSIIATLVILADQVLKAYLFQASKILSVFVGLIITNCIVMGRAEAFALSNNPWRSLLDGVGNGLGYSFIILMVATFREVLGSGTFYGFPVVPAFAYDLGFQNNGLMVLAPAAFFIIGLFIWLQRSLTRNLVEEE